MGNATRERDSACEGPTGSVAKEPKQFGEGLFGVDVAGSGPASKFGDIDTAVGRLAVVHPRLRSAETFADVPLCQPRPLPQLAEKAGDQPVRPVVLGLGHAPEFRAKQG